MMIGWFSCVACIDGICTGTFHENKSVLIAVFPGATERTAAAVALAAEGRGRRLVVSSPEPTAERVRPWLKRRADFPSEVGFVDAGPSRDTFEDALVTARRIREHGFQRVILVTSDDHMLRSCLKIVRGAL